MYNFFGMTLDEFVSSKLAEEALMSEAERSAERAYINEVLARDGLTKDSGAIPVAVGALAVVGAYTLLRKGYKLCSRLSRC